MGSDRFDHHRERSRFSDEPDAHVVTQVIKPAHGADVVVEYRFTTHQADDEQHTFRLREVWTSKRKHFVDDGGTAGEAILHPHEYDIPVELIESLIRDCGADAVICEDGLLLGELVLKVGDPDG